MLCWRPRASSAERLCNTRSSAGWFRNWYSPRTPSIGEDDGDEQRWPICGTEEAAWTVSRSNKSSRVQLPPTHDLEEEDHLSKTRTKRLVAVAVGLSLVAAACGDDDDGDDAADTADTVATEETAAGAATEDTEAAAEPEAEQPKRTGEID